MKTITENDLYNIFEQSPYHMQALTIVRDLRLPDCWIAAGFVRNYVWDHAHNYKTMTSLNDVDVVFFDPDRTDDSFDLAQERKLFVSLPSVPWSVKNQARMHIKNKDRPYTSTADALTHWPETATAVGIRLNDDNSLSLMAPLGIDDLTTGMARPTLHMRQKNILNYRKRMRDKKWPQKWPHIKLLDME